MKNFENQTMLIELLESNDKFEVLDFELEWFEFNSKENGIEIDLDFIDYNDIEKGLLLQSEGYRGKLNYEGIILVKGVVYWVDLVSEGIAIELEGSYESNVESLKAQSIL